MSILGIEDLLSDMSEQLGFTMNDDSFKNTGHCYEQHTKQVEDSCKLLYQAAYSHCTIHGADPSPLSLGSKLAPINLVNKLLSPIPHWCIQVGVILKHG